jgi:hypothetical protein
LRILRNVAAQQSRFLEHLLEKDCCDPERALENPQNAGMRT